MRLCVYAAFSLSIQRRERINIRVHKEGDETCPYCRPEKHERGEKSKPFQSKKRIETSSPLCPNLSIYVRINIGKEGWSMNRNGISTTVLINSSTPDDFLSIPLIRKKFLILEFYSYEKKQSLPPLFFFLLTFEETFRNYI